MPETSKRFFLPGMGASSHMYNEVWQSIAHAQFLDWPPYTGEQTLTQVAHNLIELHQMKRSDAFIGTSLGGMVACEIVKILGSNRVFLIASATDPTEVQSLLKYFSSLANFTPIEMVQALSGKSNALLLDMFNNADPAFIRSMSQAIFKWEGIQKTNIEVVRIHGKKDRIIP